ncbi:hypothetical protein OPQ81_000034 [Rhizoctonia solani]|nr:hypothetical protein OPQ81_000034 [Rhizoctonia solani]
MGDDEEEQAATEAAAQGKKAVPCSGAAKPCMHDLFGNEQHITGCTKELLFAFSLCKGALQTRGIFVEWFHTLYEMVWCKKLPGIEYNLPSDIVVTVAVNSLSTYHNQIKENLWSVACGMFNEAPVTEEEQEINRTQFNWNWLDGYHYINPETKYGPFEGRLVSKVINIGLFKSRTSLGARFKEFFKDMEELLVAYILAMLQFCIEEWELGSYEPLEMDADYLLSLYICHYKGLVDARKEQPDLMEELRKTWWSKALASCQGNSSRKVHRQPIVQGKNVCSLTMRRHYGNSKPSSSHLHH